MKRGHLSKNNNDVLQHTAIDAIDKGEMPATVP
jgi:hypothetical protein